MSILGDRIKKERELLNFTREDLGKKIGVSYSAIAMYEQGKREPSNELALKMCEIFNCSMDYLTGKTDIKNLNELFKEFKKRLYNRDIIDSMNTYIMRNNAADQGYDYLNYLEDLTSFFQNSNLNSLSDTAINEFIKKYPKKDQDFLKANIYKIIDELTKAQKGRDYYTYLSSYSDISSKFYMCPVYGQISAGIPNWAEECIEGRIPIDPTLMDIVDPEECFFLRVNGESMNKVVQNGSYALIRKTDWVENGEIAVVLVNGYDATLKKFSKQGDLVVLEPMSDDSSFQVQVYDKTTPIKILGKYIGKFEMK